MDKHPEFASYVVDNGSPPTTNGTSNAGAVPSSGGTTDTQLSSAGNGTDLPSDSGVAAGAGTGAGDSTAAAAPKPGGRPRAATVANTQDLEKVALDTVYVRPSAASLRFSPAASCSMD